MKTCSQLHVPESMSISSTWLLFVVSVTWFESGCAGWLLSCITTDAVDTVITGGSGLNESWNSCGNEHLQQFYFLNIKWKQLLSVKKITDTT